MFFRDISGQSGAGCRATIEIGFQRNRRRLNRRWLEMVKKTTRFTIETDRTLIVRRGSLGRAWCEACARETEMVSLDVLERLAGGGQRQIRQWIDDGDLHVSAPQSGLARVCLCSLLRLLVTGMGTETAFTP